MLDKSHLLAILWLLAIGMLLSMCLPPLIHALGLSRYQIDEDHTVPEPPPAHDDFTTDMLRQLEALGFKPLGTLTETIDCFMLHWRWSCRQAVYGSKEQGAFAVLYRFLPEEPARLGFATCFDDGAMAWTGNHSEDIRLTRDDYVRWGSATDDLAELLSLHREAANRLGQARQPVAHDQLSTLTPVLAIHSRRFVYSDRMAPLMFFTTMLVLACILPWIVSRALGVDSPVVPILLILEGAIYWSLQQRALSERIGSARRKEVAGARDQESGVSDQGEPGAKAAGVRGRQ